jgi:baseplate J-like protein
VPFEAPKVDPRTAKEIIEQAETLLKEYVPEWKETFSKKPDQARGALIAVFARYAELIVERLNRVPEKNFLAFLDLLGASLLPPQSARVPLTFSLAQGSAADTVVPAGTQVAAAPLEGEKEPVIFEVESELVVTAAQLTSIFSRDPAQGRYDNHRSLIGKLASSGTPAFGSELPVSDIHCPVEHILYIGHDTAFGYPDLRYSYFVFSGVATSNKRLKELLDWQTWNGKDWVSKEPDYHPPSDAGPASSGVVEAKVPVEASEFELYEIRGKKKRWIRCRLKEPMKKPITGSYKISPVQFRTEYSIDNKPIDRAFANEAPLDTSKDFFPFGEQPRFNDTLYLAVKEAGSVPISTLTIDISSTTIKQNDPKAAQLAWEFWSGKAWKNLTSSELKAWKDAGRTTPDESIKLLNDVKLNKEYKITFGFDEAAISSVNGIEAYWIRVRLTGGSYGTPASYKDISQSGNPEYRLIPANYDPPLIRSIKVSYTKESKFEFPPESDAESKKKRIKVPDELAVLTYNDFAYEEPDYISQEPDVLWPFHPTRDSEPTLYLGFSLPAGRSRFPNRKNSILICIQEPESISSASIARARATGQQPVIEWQYSSANSANDGWSKLFVRDGTENFSRSGIVEFLAPADFAARSEFNRANTYWIRTVVKKPGEGFNPRLRGVFANTVMAGHAITIKNEILGSSDGSKNQKYRTTHRPLLTSHRLEVREPDRPSATEIAKIKQDLETMEEHVGSAVTERASDAAEIEKDGWVLWVEVSDFYGSGPNDRHYVIDHLTGEIRFGDGQNGKLPPAGSSNIRLSYYRTGGGVAGNRAAGTITQMKTTVPYIDSVTNYLPALGGVEGETYGKLIDRAPRMVRHRGRAVTIEDYEDLARLASPDVARARCVPLYDLARNWSPDESQREPGTVSLIIVPNSKAPNPMPDMELIRRVHEYVTSRTVPVVKLVVIGPEYIRVEAEIEVAVISMDVANEVELAIAASLAAFLHPLTGGGPDATGWDFGRRPQASNFYRLIEAIPGVNYVRSLKLFGVKAKDKPIDYTEAQATKGKSPLGVDYSLVYSGTHKISSS